MDDAVSPIISEMLLIALVLIIVPTVTISLMNQLPEDRTPVVNIQMDYSDGSVSLYHKGGDYIQKGNIEILVNDKRLKPANLTYNSDTLTFDLGDSVKFDIEGNNGKNIVIMVAKGTVVFRGVC